jgi:predicted ATPase
MLLERERPMAELATWWQEACRGEGRVALVAGQAGIGKSTLVRELERRVSGRKLVGGCEPLSTPRPPPPATRPASRSST